MLVQIAGDGDTNGFLLDPLALGKRAVDTNGDYISVEVAVGAEAGGEVTHFRGAHAGEGEREKENHGVFLAIICAERHVTQPEIVLLAWAIAGF